MIEKVIDTLLHKLEHKGLSTPKVKLYSEATKAKFYQARWSLDILREIEHTPNVEGNTTSQEALNRISTKDKIVFFCECFWDFLRSSIDIVVLMEFKIKTIKLKRTIIDCDFDSLIEDINMAFIESNEKDKAAKQIDQTIRALRNGSLHLSGINPHIITHYYPVIVTFQNWPLGPFVYDLIRRMISKSGLLRQSYCAPVEILSCEELEYIEAMVTSNELSAIDIPSLIRDKINSGYESMSMYAFLWDKRHDMLKNNKYITDKMNEMLEMIMSQLKLTG